MRPSDSAMRLLSGTSNYVTAALFKRLLRGCSLKDNRLKKVEKIMIGLKKISPTNKERYYETSHIKRIVSLLTLISFIISYPLRVMASDSDDENRTRFSTLSTRKPRSRAQNGASDLSAVPLSTMVTIQHNAEPLLADEDRNDHSVQQWLETCVFGEGIILSDAKKKTMFAIEVFSGSARGTVYFKLGYDLAVRLPAANPWPSLLGYVYGGCVFLPMAVLGTRSSARVLKKIMTGKLQAEKDIEREHECGEQSVGCAIKSSALTAGIFSAPPLTYLAYAKLHTLLDWGWLVPGVPTYYVRTLIDYDATTALIQRVQTYMRVRSDRAQASYDADGGAVNREALLTSIRDTYLNPARSIINSFNFEQADRFTRALDQQPDVLEKTKRISHPQSIVPAHEVTLQTDHQAKQILSIIGGFIGVYGAWIYYPMAAKSFAPILTIIGVDPTESLQKTLATISLLSTSPVTYTSAESSIGKFYSAVCDSCASIYNACSSCCRTNAQEERVVDEETRSRERVLMCKRAGAALLSTFLAGCFAGTQIEIVLEYFNIEETAAKINMSASMLSTFSLVFWAVDELLLDYLKASDPRTPLLAKVDTINKKLNDMSDNSLRSLAGYLQAAPEGEVLENARGRRAVTAQAAAENGERIPLLNSPAPERGFFMNCVCFIPDLFRACCRNR